MTVPYSIIVGAQLLEVADMNEITIFALALLAVPVFARFAKETTVNGRRIYHLFGLGGLFLLLGEITRITSVKIGFIAAVMPVMDIGTSILAYLSVLVGTVWIAYYSMRHLKEV